MPRDDARTAIETAAQAVLDARAQFPQSSLADLYEPHTTKAKRKTKKVIGDAKTL